jgi:hypothetical protein
MQKVQKAGCDEIFAKLKDCHYIKCVQDAHVEFDGEIMCFNDLALLRPNEK